MNTSIALNTYGIHQRPYKLLLCNVFGIHRWSRLTNNALIGAKHRSNSSFSFSDVQIIRIGIMLLQIMFAIKVLSTIHEYLPLAATKLMTDVTTSIV